MYSPNYTITHHILNYIVRYELCMQKISSTPIPETYFNEQYEKIQSNSIDKLGELTSYPIGYTKALDVQRGKVLNTAKFRVFSNYRSVTDFINVYSSTKFLKPSTELVVHLNKLQLKRIVDDWEGGKLRTFSEKPSGIYDTWYELRDFYPNLNPKAHFDDIFKWITESKIQVNKLIQLSVLLYEFIDKAPFTHLNQITSIETITLLLKEYGYNYRNLVSPVVAFNSISEDIKLAFKMSKSKRDLTYFIEAILYSLSMHIIDLEHDITNLYKNRVKKYSKLNESLNPRQIKTLEYLDVEKRITRHEYAKMMGVNFMTAFRDLQDLLEKEHVQQKGAGRGTYYILKGHSEIEKEEEKILEVFGE